MSSSVPTAHHTLPPTASWLALVTTMVGIVASAVFVETVQLAVKLLVAAVVAVFLGVTGASATGATQRLSNMRAERAFRKLIRRNPDMVNRLRELVDRASRQLSRDSSYTDTFDYVLRNIVRQRITTNPPATGPNWNWASIIDGMSRTWAEFGSQWPNVNAHLARMLDRSAGEDTYEYIEAAELFRPFLASFFTFTQDLVRCTRQLRLEWTDDDLDQWDSFKSDANMIREMAISLYRDLGLRLTGQETQFWAPRVLSLKDRGDPDAASTTIRPPQGS